MVSASRLLVGLHAGLPQEMSHLAKGGEERLAARELSGGRVVTDQEQ